jgi:hypothetical protein
VPKVCSDHMYDYMDPSEASEHVHKVFVAEHAKTTAGVFGALSTEAAWTVFVRALHAHSAAFVVIEFTNRRALAFIGAEKRAHKAIGGGAKPVRVDDDADEGQDTPAVPLDRDCFEGETYGAPKMKAVVTAMPLAR